MSEMATLDYVDDISNDVCPICKTDKYLNSNMQFLINTECFHKMCDSCVDRIFSLGPTKCPYPDCEKVLRKSEFKTQIFEDIGVEKEVYVRKRIFAIFNKSEEDFKTLEEYNMYLERVELVISNLLNNNEVKQTEEFIAKYRQDNLKSIQQNNINFQKQKDHFVKAEKQKQLINEERKKLSMKYIRETKEEEKHTKQQITNGLLNSTLSSEAVVKNATRNLLKQTSARRKKFELQTKSLQDQFLTQEDLELQTSSGRLKNRKAAKVLSPFTPFNGDRNLEPGYAIETEYFDPHLDKLLTDKLYSAGGIRVKQVYEKSLFEAFMGLECFITDEK